MPTYQPKFLPSLVLLAMSGCVEKPADDPGIVSAPGDASTSSGSTDPLPSSTASTDASEPTGGQAEFRCPLDGPVAPAEVRPWYLDVFHSWSTSMNTAPLLETSALRLCENGVFHISHDVCFRPSVNYEGRWTYDEVEDVVTLSPADGDSKLLWFQGASLAELQMTRTNHCDSVNITVPLESPPDARWIYGQVCLSGGVEPPNCKVPDHFPDPPEPYGVWCGDPPTFCGESAWLPEMWYQ